MELKLLSLEEKDIQTFKNDMMEAFRLSAKNNSDKYSKEDEVLPEKDIDESLNNENSYAYKAVLDNKMVGGAIVNIDKETNINHLDFLYVKSGIQNKGIGYFIWSSLEKLYPNAKIWETVTPYFDKRNIHFYVNTCGFHIIEFYNSRHKDPNSESGTDEMFRFQKVMKK